MSLKRLAVLLSGRGSNFAAIHQASVRGEIPAEIVVVISNRPDAAGIERSRALGLNSYVVDHQAFPNRAAHEEAVLAILNSCNPDLVVLAGYMRRLSPVLIAPFRNRIVNIHPSLLPAFPGLDAQQQALEYGVRVTGCTVHLVDEQIDHGPIVVQRAVPVMDDDDSASLSARILSVEHRAFIEGIAKLCQTYQVEGRRIRFGA